MATPNWPTANGQLAYQTFLHQSAFEASLLYTLACNWHPWWLWMSRRSRSTRLILAAKRRSWRRTQQRPRIPKSPKCLLEARLPRSRQGQSQITSPEVQQFHLQVQAKGRATIWQRRPRPRLPRRSKRMRVSPAVQQEIPSLHRRLGRAWRWLLAIKRTTRWQITWMLVSTRIEVKPWQLNECAKLAHRLSSREVPRATSVTKSNLRRATMSSVPQLLPPRKSKSPKSEGKFSSIHPNKLL